MGRTLPRFDLVGLAGEVLQGERGLARAPSSNRRARTVMPVMPSKRRAPSLPESDTIHRIAAILEIGGDALTSKRRHPPRRSSPFEVAAVIAAFRSASMERRSAVDRCGWRLEDVIAERVQEGQIRPGICVQAVGVLRLATDCRLVLTEERL